MDLYYNKKLVPVEILDLKIGDNILINFYDFKPSFPLLHEHLLHKSQLLSSCFMLA